MFGLYVACYCIALFHISDGRTVQAIIGRNVSFSWSFSVKNDAIDILHGSTPFLLVWPAKSYIRPYKKDNRLLIIGNKTTHYTFNVTISILGVTENDSGIYSVQQQFDSEEFDDSVLLEVFDKRTIPRITLARDNMSDASIVLQCSSSRALADKVLWKLNGSTIENNSKYFKSNTFLYIMNPSVNDEYNVYTCEEFGERFESEPYKISIWPRYKSSTTDHYTTTSMTVGNYTATHEYPSPRHLVYVVLGIGTTLAVVLFICLLRKCRTCSPVGGASNSNSLVLSNRIHRDENLEEGSRSEYYWTIVSNATGEMNTAVETNIEQRKTLIPVCERNVPKDNKSNESINVIEVTTAIEFEGYIDPIHSLSMEHVDYIHPIHTGPEDTNPSQKHHTI